MRKAKFAFIAIAMLVFVAPLASAPPAQAATYDSNLRNLVEESLYEASKGSEYSAEWGWNEPKRPKSVYVRCFNDAKEFERSLTRRGVSAFSARLAIAYHVYGTGNVNMRAGTCKLANEFLFGHITQDTAGAFKTLLHEAIHRQGIRDEQMAEAYAIAATHSAAILAAEWNNGPENGMRAMRLAWQQSQRYIARSYLCSWAQVYNLWRTGETWAGYTTPYVTEG
jgi:hypothetical protein